MLHGGVAFCCQLHKFRPQPLCVLRLKFLQTHLGVVLHRSGCGLSIGTGTCHSLWKVDGSEVSNKLPTNYNNNINININRQPTCDTFTPCSFLSCSASA